MSLEVTFNASFVGASSLDRSTFLVSRGAELQESKQAALQWANRI